MEFCAKWLIYMNVEEFKQKNSKKIILGFGF
jgi:hypothetical protein